MAKYDYDSMDKQGNAGKGILIALGLAGGAFVKKQASNSSKRKNLNLELQRVQSELSQERSRWFPNSQKIEDLKVKESNILKQLKKL